MKYGLSIVLWCALGLWASVVGYRRMNWKPDIFFWAVAVLLGPFSWFGMLWTTSAWSLTRLIWRKSCPHE